MDYLWGELLGTFCLLFLGISSGLILASYQQKPNYVVIGICWGGAIFIGNLVGLLFGSNKLNPVFALISLLEKETSLSYFLLEIISQAIGASFAMLAILLFFRRQLLNSTESLSLLTTVPQSPHLRRNIGAEFSGTFILVIVSKLFALWQLPKVLAISFISIILSLLIIRIAPITGASFNPIRDFIPRLSFHLFLNDNHQRVWKQSWITIGVPVIGGLVGNLTFSLVTRF